MLKAACILLYIGFASSTSLSSLSSAISRILDQSRSSKSHGPLVLVISRTEDSSSSVELPSPKQSEENGISLLTLLSQFKKPHPKPSQYRAHVQQRQKRLPVYNSLLSLRNSLRCGAQSECQDECAELPRQKKKKCNRKCEKEYECPKNTCDDCDDKENTGSTKGPPPDCEDQKC